MSKVIENAELFDMLASEYGPDTVDRAMQAVLNIRDTEKYRAEIDQLTPEQYEDLVLTAGDLLEKGESLEIIETDWNKKEVKLEHVVPAKETADESAEEATMTESEHDLTCPECGQKGIPEGSWECPTCGYILIDEPPAQTAHIVDEVVGNETKVSADTQYPTQVENKQKEGKMDKIKVLRTNPVGKIVFADVSVNGIVLKGFRVYPTAFGPAVGVPSQKSNKDGRYYPTVWIEDPALRARVNEVVLDAVNTATSAKKPAEAQKASSK